MKKNRQEFIQRIVNKTLKDQPNLSDDQVQEIVKRALEIYDEGAGTAATAEPETATGDQVVDLEARATSIAKGLLDLPPDEDVVSTEPDASEGRTFTEEDLTRIAKSVLKEAANHDRSEAHKATRRDYSPSFDIFNKRMDRDRWSWARFVKYTITGDPADAPTEVAEIKRYKALSGRTGSEGAYLIPTEHSRQVIDRLRDKAVVRSMAREVPMSGDVLELPRLSASASVSWGDELAEITQDSTTAFDMVKLTATEVRALIKVSNKLLRKADPAVDDIIENDVADMLRQEEDRVFLVGPGINSQPTGIENITGVTTLANVNLSALNFLDLKDMFHQVELAETDADGVVTHPTVKDQLERIVDGHGRFIYQDNVADRNPGTLYGRPVGKTTKCKGSTETNLKLFVGNWQEVLIGQSMDLELSASEHIFYTSGATAIRATMAVGFGMRHENAMCVRTVVDDS